MPEVVEVKIYADFIRKHLLNHKINRVKIIQGRYKKHGPFDSHHTITKNRVIEVDSKGKFIYVGLSNGTYVCFTLGLSGGFLFKNKNGKVSFARLFENYELYKPGSNEPYVKNILNHLNVEFTIDTGSLYFFDMLSFGTVSVMTKDELAKKLSKLGPDIMNPTTTLAIFKARIMDKRYATTAIGNILMNQKVISGVGNYLRADCLWMAKVSPFRKAKTLTNNEIKKIFDSIRVLVWSDYDRAYAIKHKIIPANAKNPGAYKKLFFVYEQERDIYNNIVIKEELYEGSQKRSIYWVKSRQK